MKIGVDSPRGWNSKEVGFPLEWMAIKTKYDSSRRAINHPCLGGALERGKVRVSCCDLEIEPRREDASKSRGRMLWWRVGGSQSGGRRSTGDRSSW
ncbi:hypothetical protein AVEN_179559-1 [Araneus ventricosus]|uniref:Uncharacterized protein n=1 Tax=Araneus ventricosus TaxID=182803 RepID=A0A4Y2BC44_ARAVE|nr:hypothetical protein AVEN_179559-1 [Araneus ventricosus]